VRNKNDGNKAQKIDLKEIMKKITTDYTDLHRVDTEEKLCVSKCP